MASPKRFRVVFIRKAEFEVYVDAATAEELLAKFQDDSVHDIMVLQNHVIEEEIKEVSEAVILEEDMEAYGFLPMEELN